MSSRKIALVVATIHHSQVRCREALARKSLRRRKLRNQCAYHMGLTQQIISVAGRDEIIKNRFRDNLAITLVERGGNTVKIEW